MADATEDRIRETAAAFTQSAQNERFHQRRRENETSAVTYVEHSDSRVIEAASQGIQQVQRPATTTVEATSQKHQQVQRSAAILAEAVTHRRQPGENSRQSATKLPKFNTRELEDIELGAANVPARTTTLNTGTVARNKYYGPYVNYERGSQDRGGVFARHARMMFALVLGMLICGGAVALTVLSLQGKI